MRCCLFDLTYDARMGFRRIEPAKEMNMIVVASGFDVADTKPTCRRCDVGMETRSYDRNDESLSIPGCENDVKVDRTITMHFLSFRSNDVPFRMVPRRFTPGKGAGAAAFRGRLNMCSWNVYPRRSRGLDC